MILVHGYNDELLAVLYWFIDIKIFHHIASTITGQSDILDKLQC